MTSIEPRIARTDDTLSIEGTFTGAVIVSFPGGTQVTASVLGSHRASVVVPPSATEGELTVSACGAVHGPILFRRPSFVPGLGGFEAIYDQSNVARQTPKLVTARARHTAITIGRRVYVVGGVGPSGELSSVEQASVNADGTLGPFVIDAGVALVTARAGHTASVIGGSLYIVGGTAGAPLGSVERAAITAGGGLGSFAEVPEVMLTTARQGHASVIVGNSLYVLGGADGNVLDSVERARINADGTLQPFAPVPGAHLAAARQGHTVAIIGDHVYAMGGAGASGLRSDLERAAINGDGSLGPFVSVPGVNMVTARAGHTAIVLGNEVYVVGGSGASGSVNSVERASINADGSIGAFVMLHEAMLAPRAGHATAVVGNYLHIIGGAGTAALASIERVVLDAGVRLEGPTPATGIALAIPRSESTMVVIGDYLYVVGGAMASSTAVERAAIHSDGTLGPFAVVPGVTLVAARRRHAAAVIGNYLYVIAGTGPTGALASVERAPIQADGSLGSFAIVPGVALTAGRQAHSSVVIGNALHVIAGSNGTTVLGSVERATIGADGSLGPFTPLPSIALTTAREGHKSFVIGSYIYVLGGDNSDVERAAIASDGSVGPFVGRLTLTNAERYGSTATVVGNHVFVLGGASTPLSQGIGEVSSVSQGVLTGFAASDDAYLRYGHSVVVLGNRLYALGGVAAFSGNQDQGIDTFLLK